MMAYASGVGKRLDGSTTPFCWMSQAHSQNGFECEEGGSWIIKGATGGIKATRLAATWTSPDSGI